MKLSRSVENCPGGAMLVPERAPPKTIAKRSGEARTKANRETADDAGCEALRDGANSGLRSEIQ